MGKKELEKNHINYRSKKEKHKQKINILLLKPLLADPTNQAIIILSRSQTSNTEGLIAIGKSEISIAPRFQSIKPVTMQDIWKQRLNSQQLKCRDEVYILPFTNQV